VGGGEGGGGVGVGVGRACGGGWGDGVKRLKGGSRQKSPPRAPLKKARKRKTGSRSSRGGVSREKEGGMEAREEVSDAGLSVGRESGGNESKKRDPTRLWIAGLFREEASKVRKKELGRERPSKKEEI